MVAGLTAATYPVRTPGWSLYYAGVNITSDIIRMVNAITYTSRVGEESGDLEIELEDSNQRWQGPWYPVQGDVIQLQIGFVGTQLADCGLFQIDELELNGPPDVMHMRCIAAYITPDMRTSNTLGYENQSLLTIAQTVAAKHGLTLVSAPADIDVSFLRITQKQESDLAFLKRLAQEHNYTFTIKPPNLIFYSRQTLEAEAAVETFTRNQVTTFKFKARSQQIYAAATVSYQDPDTKSLINATAVPDVPVPTTDTLKRVIRCENGAQALLKAQGILHQKDMGLVEGTVEMPGNIALAGGNNVAFTGFGVYDGKYQITTARHKLERKPGYTTEVEVRKVE